MSSCCYEHSGTGAYLLAFSSAGHMSRNGVDESYGNSVLNLLSNCQTHALDFCIQNIFVTIEEKRGTVLVPCQVLLSFLSQITKGKSQKMAFKLNLWISENATNLC